MISIIHLKSTSIEEDFYDKEKKESESIKDVQEKTKNIYEIEKIVAKRFIKIERARHSKIQYRVK
jgi:CRISPR/Cas system CSM-associated protein Csm5 (group 7 of RAMP superfamily)